jgi:hypothetical protein
MARKFIFIYLLFIGMNCQNVTEAQNNASTWRVVDGDADLYELDVEPSLAQLGGRIQFCEDFVLFNATYIDVSDNYFWRIK